MPMSYRSSNVKYPGQYNRVRIPEEIKLFFPELEAQDKYS